MLLLLVALAVSLQVDCKDMKNKLHREKRADDVSLSGLHALFEQQANTIQTLQSELIATKNALTVSKTEAITRLNAAENRLNGAEGRLTAVENKQSNRVAFTVHFSTDPVTVGSKATLKFDHFVTNVGGGYDRNTGIFTASVAGLYAFYLNIMNDNNDTRIEVRLVKNGASIDYTLAEGHNSQAGFLDQGSYLSTLHLNKGDKVWNEQWCGTTHLRGGPWTVFSGSSSWLTDLVKTSVNICLEMF